MVILSVGNNNLADTVLHLYPNLQFEMVEHLDSKITYEALNKLFWWQIPIANMNAAIDRAIVVFR